MKNDAKINDVIARGLYEHRYSIDDMSNNNVSRIFVVSASRTLLRSCMQR